MPSPDSDVLIICAGDNSLVCAYYLAAKSLKVTMPEGQSGDSHVTVTRLSPP